MGKSGEPSVEEILESIKSVMERDNRASAADAKRRNRPEAEEPAAQASAEAGVDDVDEDEVLDLADLELADVVELEDSDDVPLITEATRGAMQENLAALAMLAEPGARPQIVRSGETSLEGLTRELMRPWSTGCRCLRLS